MYWTFVTFKKYFDWLLLPVVINKLIIIKVNSIIDHQQKQIQMAMLVLTQVSGQVFFHIKKSIKPNYMSQRESTQKLFFF